MPPCFASPAAEIDPAQHYFAIALGQMPHLRNNLIGGSAAASSAHEWNDAERAAVIAAVLDLEVGARAIAGRVFHRGGEKIVLRENITDVNLSVERQFGFGDDIRNLNFMRVSHHPVDPGQCRQLLGCALRVTARDQDARGGILAMHAMDGFAHIFVSRTR